MAPAARGANRDTGRAMSQESIWRLEIGFIGSGEDGQRANNIIITARKRGKPVYGEGPWWSVSYENVETPAEPRWPLYLSPACPEGR